MEEKTGSSRHGRRRHDRRFELEIGFVLYSKYFSNQPDNVNVFWAYGQCSEALAITSKAHARVHRRGNVCGAALPLRSESNIDSILEHATVSTSMIPTSPVNSCREDRRSSEGHSGAASISPSSDSSSNCREMSSSPSRRSVRTAMMAVWGLTALDKPMIPCTTHLRPAGHHGKHEGDSRYRGNISRHPARIAMSSRRWASLSGFLNSLPPPAREAISFFVVTWKSTDVFATMKRRYR